MEFPSTRCPQANRSRNLRDCWGLNGGIKIFSGKTPDEVVGVTILGKPPNDLWMFLFDLDKKTAQAQVVNGVWHLYLLGDFFSRFGRNVWLYFANLVATILGEFPLPQGSSPDNSQLTWNQSWCGRPTASLKKAPTVPWNNTFRDHSTVYACPDTTPQQEYLTILTLRVRGLFNLQAMQSSEEIVRSNV